MPNELGGVGSPEGRRQPSVNIGRTVARRQTGGFLRTGETVARRQTGGFLRTGETVARRQTEVSERSSKSDVPDLKVRIWDETKGAISEYTANELDDKIFNTLWDLWKTPDENGPFQAANIIEALDKNVHIVGLKDPSRALLSAVGIPDASFWSSIIQEAPVDAIDEPLGCMKRLVLIGGIIAGFASGHLGMAYVCLKELLRSEAHRLSAAAIEHLLSGGRSNRE